MCFVESTSKHHLFEQTNTCERRFRDRHSALEQALRDD